MSCPLKYIGQTDQPFKMRYKEHVQDIKKIAIIQNI
jgi:hypothetical protein